MYLCDWSDFEDSVFQLPLKRKKGKSFTPFAALGLSTSLAAQRLVAEIWTEDKHPFNSSLGPIPKPAKKSKIRIATTQQTLMIMLFQFSLLDYLSTMTSPNLK